MVEGVDLQDHQRLNEEAEAGGGLAWLQAAHLDPGSRNWDVATIASADAWSDSAGLVPSPARIAESGKAKMWRSPARRSRN